LSTDARQREDIARFNVRRRLSDAELEMALSLDPRPQADPIIVHVHCAFLSALKAHHQNGTTLTFTLQRDEAKRAILNTRSHFRCKHSNSTIETAVAAWVNNYGPPTAWDQGWRDMILTPRFSKRTFKKTPGNKAARICRPSS
jgi:hypothetical protein